MEKSHNQSMEEEPTQMSEDVCVLCGYVSAEEFFCFPDDKNVRERWARFCGMAVEKVKPHYHLCDRHFKPEDYQKILKPASVPSVISCSQSTSVSQNSRPSPNKNVTSCPDSQSSTVTNELSGPTITDFIRNVKDLDREFCLRFFTGEENGGSGGCGNYGEGAPSSIMGTITDEEYLEEVIRTENAANDSPTKLNKTNDNEETPEKQDSEEDLDDSAKTASKTSPTDTAKCAVVVVDCCDATKEKSDVIILSKKKKRRYKNQMIAEFKCTICPKKFCYKGNLIKHQRFSHGSRYMVQCPICRKQFLLPYLLNRHMKSHALDK